MKVLNLYGGPGSGKSTLAAYLFAQLKMQGVKAELVSEYVKDATYSQNTAALSDQGYLVAKHNHRLARIRKSVDVAVCDCSLLNAVVYADTYVDPFERQQALVAASTAIALYNTYDNIGVYVPRYKDYAAYGRSQTAEDAVALDRKFLTRIPPLLGTQSDTEFSMLMQTAHDAGTDSEDLFKIALHFVEFQL